MILTKNITAKKHLCDILRAVARHLAASGEILVTGRIIMDNDGSRAAKDEPSN
jgi:uncharacterized protein (UPF0332 family)